MSLALGWVAGEADRLGVEVFLGGALDVGSVVLSSHKMMRASLIKTVRVILKLVEPGCSFLAAWVGRL